MTARKTLLVLYLVPTMMWGQTDYQTFRNNLLSDYKNFRTDVLERYSDFLAQIWTERQHFLGRQSDASPKPHVQPIKTEEPQSKTVEQTPKQGFVESPKQDIPLNVTPQRPELEQANVSVNWYGMEMNLPKISIPQRIAEVSPENVATSWQGLYDDNVAEKVIPSLAIIANTCQFNDWCVYTFVREYVRTLLPNQSDYNTRTLLCHYLLLYIGFDVRLTMNNNNLFLLLPCYQQVYAKGYLMLDDTPYYIYGEGKEDPNAGYYTYQAPKENGKPFNLVFLKQLQLPFKPHAFHYKKGGIAIDGEINQYLINIMVDYPQMPIPCYAMSQGDTNARQQVLASLKNAIIGMDKWEAANFLLHFVQSFDYATDEEQFGKEKPFFFEETLYYPKCDCEDRAIFYGYLIKELLRTDIHLVHYPGHECTAISLGDNITGDGYMYKGHKYLIADPTYIGANVGMCMPNYRDRQPEVELIEEKRP